MACQDRQVNILDLEEAPFKRFRLLRALEPKVSLRITGINDKNLICHFLCVATVTFTSKNLYIVTAPQSHGFKLNKKNCVFNVSYGEV